MEKNQKFRKIRNNEKNMKKFGKIIKNKEKCKNRKIIS